MCPAIPPLSIHPEKTIIQKDTCSPTVHCGIIYNSQDMETTYMSVNRGMDKENGVHLYNGTLLRQKKKNETKSFVEMFMDLEAVIHSEVKSEKQIPYINTYV